MMNRCDVHFYHLHHITQEQSAVSVFANDRCLGSKTVWICLDLSTPRPDARRYAALFQQRVEWDPAELPQICNHLIVFLFLLYFS